MKIVTRIFLVIALICSGVTIAIQLLKVEPRIKSAEQARDQNAQEREQQRQRADTAESNLANTKMELETTKAALQTTEASLAAKTQEADQQRQRADQMDGEKRKVEAEYATWRRNHEEFVKLNRTPEQILQTEATLKKTTQERDTFVAENKILSTTVNRHENEIIKLRGLLGLPAQKLIPPGLAGKVMAVDPKYQFVVLDVGNKHKVKREGEMIVNRDGKLVGKIRIAEVADDHSIANILPKWSSKEMTIMEGDVVIAESNQ